MCANLLTPFLGPPGTPPLRSACLFGHGIGNLNRINSNTARAFNASRNCFFIASENPTKWAFYGVGKFNVVAAWCRRMEPAPDKECRFPLSTLKPAGVDRSSPMMARLTATAAPLRKVCSSMNLKKPCGDVERGPPDLSGTSTPSPR